MSQYAPMSGKHLTAPDPNQTGWPGGIKYIVGNEAAERFSYYGMKAILQVYLTMLLMESGIVEKIAEGEATSKLHLFAAGVYAFPILGAILADKLFGKYQTILWLSMVYVAGHGVMALFHGNLEGTYAGLALIAIGSGGIKPCVSAHVGDQFGKSNWHLMKKVFQLFYFMINLGSLFAQILVPIINQRWGAGWAFGLPGILMAVATLMFWLGRKEFVHVPASPGGKLGTLDTVVGFLLFIPIFMLLFAPEVPLDILSMWWARIGFSALSIFLALAVFRMRQSIAEDDGFLAVLMFSVQSKFGSVSDRKADHPDHDPSSNIAKSGFFGAASKHFGSVAAEGPLAVLRIVSVFFLVSIFWMLFDQHGSTFVTQAKQMDRDLGFWGITFLPSQFSFVNPALVMMLIPLLLFVVLPWLEKTGVKITALRKMSAGMFLTAASFFVVYLVQKQIEAGGPGSVSIYWQLPPYIVLTLGEVLVSVTGLEFAYTQAPKRMKSVVMSFWLLFISFGNWFASLLAHEMKGVDLSQFFLVCAGLMIAAAFLFSFRSMFYVYKEYTQD